MIKNKRGAKGKSFEAEFRKKVLNAKLEAFYEAENAVLSPLNKGKSSIMLTNLESLEPGKVIDTNSGLFFDAQAPHEMPRRFTYLVAEVSKDGKIMKASRTIMYMEEAVENTAALSKAATEFRRPDFFSMSYDLSKEELKLLKNNPVMRFTDIVEDFKSKKLKIFSEYFEIKSIDLNTPLDVKASLSHVRKHIETFGSAFNKMMDEYHLGIQENTGKVNVILKEFYHKSLHAAEQSPLIKSFNYFLKEQHTAVFTMINVKGEIKLAGKVAVESIRGLGSIKRMIKGERMKINPEAPLDAETKSKMKRSINFLREMQTKLPKALTLLK